MDIGKLIDYVSSKAKPKEDQPAQRTSDLMRRNDPHKPDDSVANADTKSQDQQTEAVDKSVEVSAEYQKALDAIDAGKNIFILGPAGTGKSTFLKMIKQLYADKNPVALAPTGVAALNAGGQTLHSFFRLKPQVIKKDDIKLARRREPYKKLKLLIIDEISMVRADVFEAMDTFLKMHTGNEGKPFGGVQMVLIGDLYQLPPVVTRAEKEIFSSMYESPFFFNTESFKEASFECVEFTKIYRQTDQAFIDLLNRFRTGHVSGDDFTQINSRKMDNFPIEKIRELDPVVLTGRNVRADYINETKLGKIEKPEFTYNGEITGKFNIAEDKLPAPMELALKVGAKVMFTKNDPSKRWVNGSMGVVEALSDDEITVKVDGGSFTVAREKWETLKYAFNSEEDKWETEVVGKYVQFPLMLAYAVTVHKSQGKTLESCLVDLDTGAFADGQLYVALSRCKTFENLFIKELVEKPDVRVSKEVNEFMDRLKVK